MESGAHNVAPINSDANVLFINLFSLKTLFIYVFCLNTLNVIFSLQDTIVTGVERKNQRVMRQQW